MKLLPAFLFFYLGTAAIVLGQGKISLEGRFESATVFKTIHANATWVTAATDNGTDFLSSLPPAFTTNTYRITNTGSEDLELQGAVMGGNHASDFTIQSFPTGVIASGESEVFTVKFLPTERGTRDAQVSINSSDESRPIFTYAIVGVGSGTSEITLRGRPDGSTSWAAITDNSTTTASNNGTAFLPVPLFTLQYSEFRIDNHGVYPLRIYTNGISGPDGGKFKYDSFSFEIPPEETYTFRMKFVSETPGAFSATVTFQNNSAGNPLFDFAISGEALAPQQPEIALFGREPGKSLQAISDGNSSPAISNGTDFGASPVGTTVQRDFRITNTGNSDLSLSSATITGATSAGWSINGLDQRQ